MTAAPPFNLQPTLQDDLLIVRPLKEEDFEDLYKVASDPLIWEQHPASDRYKKEVFDELFKDAMQSGGAFAIVDKGTNSIIGSTRFHAIKESKNAIEIGWTFLARQYWGGKYNKSMKCLMMKYAFDFVENVLFYIHENNFRSRKAVEKIGGERITEIEGQLLDLRQQGTVVYNITKNKWLQPV
jgi:RimJ/RimL family protein N-acetyltransferase